MIAYSVQNSGREIVATDYWSTPNGATKTAYSINAGALRLLVAANLADEVAREAPTGRVAVLSIGPDKGDPARPQRAGLMFDDGSDSPYCLLTDLAAFDRLPTREDDWKRDFECIVYGPGLRVLARMPLRIRHTHAQDHRPVRMEDRP